MNQSSATKLYRLKQLIWEGERSGRPIPWDPEAVKNAARLRKASTAGSQGPDVDNFDVEKVVGRLKKLR